MSLPTARTALHRVVADPDAPTKLRIEALSKLNSPQRALLIRIMRDRTSPARLRALANLKYAELIERKTAKKKATTKAPDVAAANDLGLKV